VVETRAVTVRADELQDMGALAHVPHRGVGER
jgi:hypothetical protein